jgi:hypothetical protein
MNRKADYVRGAIRGGEFRGHHCHWPGCDKLVAPAAWGCKPHWYKLPPDLRRRIWRAFRPGQEQTKTPSPEYVAVARETQEWIAANHPPAQQGALEL